jgi:hypothetical protein
MAGSAAGRLNLRVKVATAQEFLDFWVENSVHADEAFSPLRSDEDFAELARSLIVAARAEGFSAAEIEGETGADIQSYIKKLVGQRNAGEATRLNDD